MKKIELLGMGALMLFATACAPTQEKTEEINDSNTPLHLLQPDYQNPYGVPSVEDIKADMDRVLHYLVDCTPTRVVNKNTGEQITDYTQINNNIG